MINRDTGVIGISIATDLMLAELFNIGTPPPDKNRVNIDRDKYDIFLINLHTITRNVITSIPYENRKEFLSKSDVVVTVYNTLRSELYLIQELCNEYKMEYSFYAPDYRPLENNKVIATGSVYTMYAKINDILRYTLGRLTTETDINQHFMMPRDIRFKLPSTYKILVNTHYYIDLLNYSHYRQLDLIESHTGNVIETKDFSLKYKKITTVDTSLFPFTETLLYVFGDRNMISSFDIKTRRNVGKLSTIDSWKINDVNGIRRSLKKDPIITKTISNMKMIFDK